MDNFDPATKAAQSYSANTVGATTTQCPHASQSRSVDDTIGQHSQPSVDNEGDTTRSGQPKRKAAQGPKNYNDGSPKRGGKKPPPPPNHIVPENANSGQTHKRKGMSDGLTEAILRANAEEPDESREAKRLRFDKSLDHPRGLKQLGLARDHMMADSRIPNLLNEALQNVQIGTPAHNDVNHFLMTVAGPVEGRKAAQHFTNALNARDQGYTSAAAGHVQKAANTASLSPVNLRIGHADTNQHVSNGTDYEVGKDGRITQHSQDVHEATLELARNKAVSYDSAFRAATSTMHHTPKEDGEPLRAEYISSSLPPNAVRQSSQARTPQDPDSFRAKTRHFEPPAPRRAQSEPPEDEFD